MTCSEGINFIKCEILEKRSHVYSTLVVENLKNNEYLILTIFPNWQGFIPEVGDIGYLEFEFVISGITKYYDHFLNKTEVYKNTQLVFKQFVKEEEKYINEDVLI